MRLFNLSVGTLILRFYLMMAIVLIAGFSGYWVLTLLALVVFFSCLMGIRLNLHLGHPLDSKTAQHQNSPARRIHVHAHHPA